MLNPNHADVPRTPAAEVRHERDPWGELKQVSFNCAERDRVLVVQAGPGKIFTLDLSSQRAWEKDLSPWAEKTLREFRQGASFPVHKDIDSITSSRWFTQLAPEWKLKLVDYASRESDETRSALVKLGSSPSFAVLSNENRCQALEVFMIAGPSGKQHLASLAGRMMDSPKRPALLDADAHGQTLLGNLHRFALQELDPRVERRKLAWVGWLLEETGDPGAINQGLNGTCSVTSYSYIMAGRNPSEYARLILGLADKDGRVMMRNGDLLTRVDDSVLEWFSRRRSTTEALLQTALMEYANGAAIRYDYNKKQHYNPATGDSLHKGLYQNERQRVLEALFGVPFETIYASNGADHLLHVLKKRRDYTPAGLRWEAPDSSGTSSPSGGDEFHSVTVLRVDDKMARVYFRNPWGPTGDSAGTVYDSPPRVLEDPKTRVESMDFGEFSERVSDIQIPKRPLRERIADWLEIWWQRLKIPQEIRH